MCGDGKVIAFVPVPFRVDTIQHKRHNRQYIGADRRIGPGGVDLTGRHVLDVVPETHPVVGRAAIRGNTVVDDHIFRNDHPAQYNLSGLCGRLDLLLRDLRREGAEQGMGSDHDPLELFAPLCSGHMNFLDGENLRQDLRPGHLHILIAFRPGPNRVLCVRLFFGILGAVCFRRRRQRDDLRHPRFICGIPPDLALGISFVGNLHFRTRHRPQSLPF